MGESSHMNECASPQQRDEQKKEGSLEQQMHGKERKSSEQSNNEIEMTSMKVRTSLKKVLFVAFETVALVLFGSTCLSFYPKIAT